MQLVKHLLKHFLVIHVQQTVFFLRFKVIRIAICQHIFQRTPSAHITPQFRCIADGHRQQSCRDTAYWYNATSAERAQHSCHDTQQQHKAARKQPYTSLIANLFPIFHGASSLMNRIYGTQTE